jgi:hypothetical protein
LSQEESGRTARGPAISRLPEAVDGLSREDRRLFDRLFRVARSTGRLSAPPEMHPWIQGQFGSLEAVQSQVVVRVTNLATVEDALFNHLRASRPMEATLSGGLRQAIDESRGDPLCRPETGTPEDVFGRVAGRHSITAANIAKYDAFHSLVVFDEHDPLEITEDRVRDYLEVGSRWAGEVLRVDPDAVYFFFMWNALWKSGASLIHGHAQVACARGMHYARAEQLRRAAGAYRSRHGGSYFDDLARVHDALGLGLSWRGVRVLASLTPVKEKEVLIVSPGLGDPLPAAIYRVLDCLVTRLGVSSFNLAIYMPPLAETPEDWSGFPHVTRIVDRGDPMSRTSDVGAMEMYAAAVISSDPFRVAAALRERFEGM